jgi:uncharacterized cupredoxin-like copper-binding protein
MAMMVKCSNNLVGPIRKHETVVSHGQPSLINSASGNLGTKDIIIKQTIKFTFSCLHPWHHGK